MSWVACLGIYVSGTLFRPVRLCRSNIRHCSIRQCCFGIVAGVDRALVGRLRSAIRIKDVTWWRHRLGGGRSLPSVTASRWRIALWVGDAVVLVADKINQRLSVVSPQTLAAAGDAALVSAIDTRRVTFEGGKFSRQSRRSTIVRHSTAVNSVRASFVMETASFSLYSGSTSLVLRVLLQWNTSLSEKVRDLWTGREHDLHIS